MDLDGSCVWPILRSVVERPCEPGFPGGYLCSNMEQACMTTKPTKRETSQREKKESPDVFVESQIYPSDFQLQDNIFLIRFTLRIYLLSTIKIKC